MTIPSPADTFKPENTQILMARVRLPRPEAGCADKRSACAPKSLTRPQTAVASPGVVLPFRHGWRSRCHWCPAWPPATVMGPKQPQTGLIIGILVAIIIVLLGASAAAYYVVMNKPQNVLGMALGETTFSAQKPRLLPSMALLA